MTNPQKLRFFRHLIQIGFKEIEVAYPAASETDFAFCRELLNNREVPDDVWIQVSSRTLSFPQCLTNRFSPQLVASLLSARLRQSPA